MAGSGICHWDDFSKGGLCGTKVDISPTETWTDVRKSNILNATDCRNLHSITQLTACNLSSIVRQSPVLANIRHLKLPRLYPIRCRKLQSRPLGRSSHYNAARDVLQLQPMY